MECPTCKYPILADWSMCRRCGAPLHVPIVEAKVPVRTALQKLRASGNRGDVTTVAQPTDARGRPDSPAARAAAHFGSAPADRPLPGAFPRRDNLLPRAIRATGASGVRAAAKPGASPATIRAAGFTVPIIGARAGREAGLRAHWRAGIVTGVVAVTLTVGVIAVWPVAFGGTSPLAATPAVKEARTTELLQSVATGAHKAYAIQHTYTTLSPALLSAEAYHVRVVGPSTVATLGTVSLRVDGPTLVTFASPADARQCVFARDDGANRTTIFATVSTTNCRASAAPATGWSAR